jgi:diguanylate cyclase (GGDEF)-like protein
LAENTVRSKANPTGTDGTAGGEALTDDAAPDDAIEVVEDQDADAGAGSGSAWRVLIVDDDEQIHSSTVFALADVTVFGRGFWFAHAYSAAEARQILSRDADFAVILLDVVMESDHAGLALVQVIREELMLRAVRIILRTGQPGYAPELTVIQNYDIDDYRTKAELTQVRLVTTLVSALRSYQQIQTIETSRRGLRRIIDAAADLGRRHVLTTFAEGVLTQIAGLLGLACDGIVLARINRNRRLPRVPTRTGIDGDTDQPYILAAAGRFAHLAGAPLSRIEDAALAGHIRLALEQQQSVFERQGVVLHVLAPSGDDLAIHVTIDQPLSGLAQELLQVFSANIAVGFDNATLFERIEALAFFDPLTGLSNRNGFLREAARHLGTGGEPWALVLVDMDDFEEVNDGLGQETGNQLLRAIAGALEALVGERRMVSRLSNDTFALLAPAGNGDPGPILEAIGSSFALPFPIGGNQIPVSASVGYCLTEGGETDAERLIRRAGMALKKAKSISRGRAQRFVPSMEEALQQRLGLVSQLGEALRAGEFLLHFQPQIQLVDAHGQRLRRQTITGVEALARWRRADGSMIPPDAFIPAAEESGRIVEIGEWVLTSACLSLGQWEAQGLDGLRMAVNVSVRQMREPGFLAMVERVIAATGIAPARLELEVTESMAMEDRSILEIMGELRDLGVSLALDDFGTGYSSLSRLHHLPVDHLKIDRSFVSELETLAESRSLVAMIVRVGHERGLSVIAEGVETMAQEEILVGLGCEEAQGYRYARPLPAAELEAYLKALRTT